MSLQNYKFIQKIGAGSYGEVWLVTETKTTKKLVLKKVSLHNASVTQRQAAINECVLLSSIQHPNIVRYCNSWEENQYMFLAMDYCECGDLYTVLKSRQNRRLLERQIVEWLIQITMALSFLHDRNILHRDIKTQNIFLGKSHVIKLGDLGIAKQLESKHDMAQTMIGTPYYMSPELFGRKPYSFKSDIWALGCVIYEMATLKCAFTAKNFSSLSYKIQMGFIPEMPNIYSQNLTDLIKSLLHRNPEKRPSSQRILRNPYIMEHIKSFIEKANLRPDKNQNSSTTPPPQTHRSVPRFQRQAKKPVDSLNVIKIRSDRAAEKERANVKSTPVTENCSDDDTSPSSSTNSSNKNTYLEKKLKDRSNFIVLENDSTSQQPEPAPKVSVPPKDPSPDHNSTEPSPEKQRPIIEGALQPCARERRRQRRRIEEGHQTLLPSDILDIAVADNNEMPIRKPRERPGQNQIDTKLLPVLIQRREDGPKESEVQDIEVTEVIDRMSDTLRLGHISQLPMSDVVDSPVQEVLDSTLKGPTEDEEETLNRTKMQNKRFVEIRKELLQTPGLIKLHNAYQILSNMDLEHEVHLKELLGEKDYELYAGKISWLKMIEERL